MEQKALAGDYVRLSQLAFLIVREPVVAEVVAVDAVLAGLRPAISPDSLPGVQRARRKLVRESVSYVRRRRVLDRLPRLRRPTPDMQLPDDTARTWDALGRLPARQQVAVALARFEGATLAEISDALDCSAGTANSYLERAAKSLAHTLGPGDLRRSLTNDMRTIGEAFVRDFGPDPDTAEQAARRSGRWRAWGVGVGLLGLGGAAVLVNNLRS